MSPDARSKRRPESRSAMISRCRSAAKAGTPSLSTSHGTNKTRVCNSLKRGFGDLHSMNEVEVRIPHGLTTQLLNEIRRSSMREPDVFALASHATAKNRTLVLVH